MKKIRFGLFFVKLYKVKKIRPYIEAEKNNNYYYSYCKLIDIALNYSTNGLWVGGTNENITCRRRFGNKHRT